MVRLLNDIHRTVGVKLPPDYRKFLEENEGRLAEDPIRGESWVKGLGNSDFVAGTTLAFRSTFPNFPRTCIIIGYGGLKTIIVNKAYEEIDEYLALNTLDGAVLSVDSLGVVEPVAASFEDWIGPELLAARLRGKYGSSLTVVLFEDEQKAEEALSKLLKLRSEQAVELEDAVVVVKDAEGEVKRSQMRKSIGKSGLIGSVTGLLAGSLLGTPVVGAVLGAAGMAAAFRLKDAGIEESFIEDLAAKFRPGSSALFTLVRKADPERVRDEFRSFGGKVLVSSVSFERAAELQAMLCEIPSREEE